MKVIKTSHHRTWLQLISVFMLLFAGMRASAQITTSDCANTYSYCTQDTVKLVPANTVLYTNFVWYGGSVAPANAIVAGNAASFNVDPTRLGSNTIYVSAPGGTYILTSEYATPSGCATKNDTLIIQYLPIPDLVTTADTICASAGQSANLASLVTDANSTSGPTAVWYPTLADAQAATNALSSTTVNPSATTKYYVRKNTTATDAEGSTCYDIDSVIIDVRCLNLGNYVWYDTNNNGIIDSGESAIDGVDVELFYDANGNGVIDISEQTPYASTTTAGGGLYLFTGLPEGNYFVGIPATQFGTGGALQYLYSSGTTISSTGITSETVAADPDAVAADTDDNGQYQKTGFYTGGVITNSYVALSYQAEPLGETPDNSAIADADDNLTVDFGFYGMSIGNTVFADVNNNGIKDGAEVGIAGVTVILYAGNGTTVLYTTMTDADGNYLFPNLPEGNYVVGVDTASPALDGQHSSDDIASSATPETDDLDDNGVTEVGGIVKTNTITLDAGSEPTGEAENGTAMGDPSVQDNNYTTDNNSNLYIDFGFVPDCPTITNPTGAQTICATESGTNLTADASSTAGNIRFVRYASAQTGNGMYTGGTVIGSSIAPVSGTATYTFSTSDFPNSGTSVLTYYVYAIMATPSADPTCRPFQEIQVVVNPKPTATNASITECENALGSGEGDFTLTEANTTVLGGQTGMTVTYHATLADAQAGTPDLTSGYAAPAGTIYVRVENAQGCYATATITLNVNPKPDFTLALATVCPGDEPEVNISGLLNGDVMLSQTRVNLTGTFNPYDASPPSITTADGLNLGATNTITVKNEFGCETDKTIVVPNITPLVCPPVNVSVKRAGE
jgi:SdrD B-like domain